MQARSASYPEASLTLVHAQDKTRQASTMAADDSTWGASGEVHVHVHFHVALFAHD
jgi:hypothetical protein